MKAICSATLLFLVFGCSQPTQSKSNNQKILPAGEVDSALIAKVDNKVDSVSTPKGDTSANKNKSVNNWLDSLMEKYILLSKNDLVRLAVKDKLNEEWLYDQTIETDTATYFVYAIGHDVVDSGARFIHDQWLYVDSATKMLYEIDLSKDSISLIRWSK